MTDLFTRSRGRAGMLLAGALIVAMAIVLGAIFYVSSVKATHSPSATQASPVNVERASALLARYESNVQQRFLSTANAQEEVVAAIDAQVLRPWEQAWRAGDAANVPGAAFVPAPKWGPAQAGIRQARWTAKGTAGAADYLSAFRAIEHVDLEVERASVKGENAGLELSLDLRGITKDGARRHDRGLFAATLKQENGAWHLASLAPTRVESLSSRAAAFRDATRELGLDAVPVYQRVEAIRRGGYAIAWGDYDGDRIVDLYVGAWGAGRLYKGHADGRYVDATGQAGLREDTLVKAAAFVDLDNDGREDLVLTRFRPAGAAGGDVIVYANQGGGRFERIDRAVPLAEKYDRAMPMSVADFNNDGRVDLYVGFPGERDFTVLEWSDRQRMGQGIFLSQPDGTLADATRMSRINENMKDRLPRFPHASVAADWDADGKMDLMVVDDRRNASPVYRNQGGAVFTEIGRSLGIENSGWGMGVAVGDYDGDGLQDVYLTNIDFTASRRLAGVLPMGSVPYNGNRLFRNVGGGKFVDATRKAGVEWAGQASGGCAWLDYDNDGDLDLYVVNGLWSGSGHEDLSSLFVRSYVNEVRKVGPALASNKITPAQLATLEEPGSHQHFMHILAGSRGASGGTLSMGGYQRNCMFRNNGNGTFTEVGYLAGVDRIEDGYVPAVVDVNRDGKLDLALRNADPGTTENVFPSVTVLENNGTDNRGLAIYLQGDGKRSNRDAIGARVEIVVGGKRQVRELHTLTGAAQSESVVFFGLGNASQVDKMTVKWPSGRVQRFTSVPAGRIHIVEGERQIANI